MTLGSAVCVYISNHTAVESLGWIPPFDRPHWSDS
jgi:hypothetical protein